MNKRARTESDDADEIRKYAGFTIISYDGDEGFFAAVPEDEIDAEDEAMINRAVHGDWMAVEGNYLLDMDEATFVNRRMEGTLKRFLAKEKKTEAQIEQEEQELRELYQQKYRDAELAKFPHRANEGGILERFDKSDSFGAAQDYFEKVFLKKHKQHRVCLFGGDERLVEEDEITGRNLGNATYSGKLSETMRRTVSTPFAINVPFSRYFCLNFSNGGRS